MTYKKLVSFVAGLAVLVASIAPASVSALGAASMTLSGATSSNGSFAVTVYEDTGSDTVTGANVELSFSQAVTGVSYDYSVGPFTAATPSGGHNAFGTVTGQNPVALVRFTLASPGSVTATVSGGSYLKHVDGTTVENFSISRGNAAFAYDAPAAAPAPTKKKVAVTTPVETETETPAPATENKEVKGETAKKDDKKEEKKVETKETGSNAAVRVVLLVLVGAAAFAGGRYAARYMASRNQVSAPAKTAGKAAATAAAAGAAKKVSNKKNSNSPAKKGKK
jgi:hypothetical protein